MVIAPEPPGIALIKVLPTRTLAGRPGVDGTLPPLYGLILD
jgi:hypothetical protein